MKNIILFSLILFGLAACATTGYQTAAHNGKLYYIPSNCKKYSYQYSDTDTLYCYDNGAPTGVILTPADSEQIEAYRLQQEANRKAWDDINESLKNLGPKTTTTNCYNYGYAVNCSSTTY